MNPFDYTGDGVILYAATRARQDRERAETCLLRVAVAWAKGETAEGALHEAARAYHEAEETLLAASRACVELRMARKRDA